MVVSFTRVTSEEFARIQAANMSWVARDDADPSTWQIAVEPARGGQWEFHPATATNLLLRLLRGQAASLYLRSLRNAEQHSFTPAR